MRILLAALAVFAVPTDGRLLDKTPSSTPYVLHVESIRLVHGAESATVPATSKRRRTTTLATPIAKTRSTTTVSLPHSTTLATSSSPPNGVAAERSTTSPRSTTVAAYITASHSATLAPSTPAPNGTTLVTSTGTPHSTASPTYTATLHTIATSAATQRLKRSGPAADALTPNTRVPRDNKQPKETQTKPSVVVNKPIPKFNEVDYDEDFQAKLLKSKTRHINTNEREEEDFNLNDYDFDVNHDEFAGKLKPMDPESKTKIKIPELDGDTEIVEIVTKPTEKVIKRKVPENKKEVKTDDNSHKKDSEIKDDFYDDKPKRILKELMYNI